MVEPLTLTGPTPRRRGRPPGARNKGGLELGKYLQAMFGGLTPGQQLAELAMVKPAEVKRAKADALALGIATDLPALQLAVVVKAQRLAQALGITRPEAWAAQLKALGELMPYVHQRQPQAEAPKDAKALPQVYLIPGEAPAGAQQAVDDEQQAAIEFIEEIPPRRP